ncbi:MAG: response regulator, partial [Bacteroidetes bacterium]|nr:response regulator [Bacteroidota bacterium]
KIGLDKMILEENVFAFHSVIKNTALQFEIKTIEKNLFFSIHIDSKINEFFKADSGRLVQVLNNLLANAIKFTKKGGVDLICKLIEDSVDKQVVQFIVKDTGIGIDEDKQETVFESFMQENSSINRKYGGTGLGLSISKQLVNLFGSELKVVSEKGVGSTFSFQIQLKKENYGLTDLPIEKNIDTTELNSKNVLLVEDNKVNQFLAITILEQFGMVVTVANNGSEAIEFLINDPYDIILMDLQMPGIDGIAATKMIRNKLNITTPIIALTANAIIGDREKCLDAGMNDYISKPFNKNELALKIIKLLKNDSVVKEPGQKELNAVVPGFSLDKLKDISPENDDFVKSMVELFCELVTETIDNIDTAVAAKNYSAIKNYAHKIKSSIDMLEIKDLIGKVREIEKAENFLDDSFFKKINYFKDSLRQVQTTLKKMNL